MSIKGGKPNDRRIVAHLMVPNGREAVDFYRRAFGAQSLYVSELPGGRIVHAQLRVEQSVLMMTEETLREGQEAPPPMSAAQKLFCAASKMARWPSKSDSRAGHSRPSTRC